jgi:hypothetical protein
MAEELESSMKTDEAPIIDNVYTDTLASLAAGVFQTAYSKHERNDAAACEAGKQAVAAFFETLSRPTKVNR